MSNVKTSRTPAALWLLVGVLASGGVAAHAKLVAHRTGENTGTPQAAAWLDIARTAEAEGNFRRAGAAYAKALEAEPFCNEALMQRPLCLAAGGDTNGLAMAMEVLVLGHAKLAVAVFDAPQMQDYVDTAPFSELSIAARSQSVD